MIPLRKSNIFFLIYIQVFIAQFHQTNVIEYIEGYNTLLRVQSDVNETLTYKKIRKINYPSEITENIAKFAIYKNLFYYDTRHRLKIAAPIQCESKFRQGNFTQLID